MHTYLAFLRGINVGGHSLIKMTALKEALEADGLTEVRTYIQSGNVLFCSKSTDKAKLGKLVAAAIKRNFSLQVAVAIFEATQWQHIIAKAPSWWGKNPAWKHNALIMIEPFTMKEVVRTIGELRPGMEKLQPGDGVLYQSIDFAMMGRGVTGSKLASNPVYKIMTIRNYNTATKLAALLDS